MEKIIKSIIFFLFIILIIFTQIVSIYKINILYNKLVVLNNEIISSHKEIYSLRDKIKELEVTTLRKPDYNAQGSLLILPDGSGYIPVLFNDKYTLEKYSSDIQWEDNLKGKKFKSFYNIKKIIEDIK